MYQYYSTSAGGQGCEMLPLAAIRCELSTIQSASICLPHVSFHSVPGPRYHKGGTIRQRRTNESMRSKKAENRKNQRTEDRG
jgi:hypothetical protein